MDEMMRDIVEWDVYNWYRAISMWKGAIGFQALNGKKVLEIGSRGGGGLSLLFAQNGAIVTCSDIDYSKSKEIEQAKALHDKYGVGEKIKYEDIDMLNIPYENEFDIVCFKSVLGGVGRNGRTDRQIAAMEQVWKALKEEGICCFVENLKGSGIIRFLRRKFRQSTRLWNYLNYSNMPIPDTKFSFVKKEAFGVVGVIGRKGIPLAVLSFFDRGLERIVAPASRYICSCVVKKGFFVDYEGSCSTEQ